MNYFGGTLLFVLLEILAAVGIARKYKNENNK